MDIDVGLKWNPGSNIETIDTTGFSIRFFPQPFLVTIDQESYLCEKQKSSKKNTQIQNSKCQTNSSVINYSTLITYIIRIEYV